VRAWAEKRFDPAIIARQYEAVFVAGCQTALPALPDDLRFRLLQNYLESAFTMQASHLSAEREVNYRQRVKNTLLMRKSERLWRPLWEKLKGRAN
jgi:hypothetical protein